VLEQNNLHTVLEAARNRMTMKRRCRIIPLIP